MRILALDVGDKRIGVAITDELSISAHSLTVITRKDMDGTLEEIKKLIEKYEVQEIVVGLPVMMNGTVGIQGEKVLQFVEELKKALAIPVNTFDERLSTRFIEKTLISADLSRARRRKVLDKLSATVILHDYLKTKGKA